MCVTYTTWNVRELISFFFSSRRRHTRFDCDWSSDVCSSDLEIFAKDTGSPGSRLLVPNGDDAAAFITEAPYASVITTDTRSEERRVGKECRSRWSPYH